MTCSISGCQPDADQPMEIGLIEIMAASKRSAR